MTITVAEFQIVVKTPTPKQITREGDRHYLIGDMWTDGRAAFWGKPMPDGVELRPVITPQSLVDFLQGCAARATVPLSIRGVRQEKDVRRPMVQAILEAKGGRLILVNAKYLAYALKGIDERRHTIRAHETDTYAPIGVFDAQNGLVAIIMPFVNVRNVGWQTIAGEGLPEWKPPEPTFDEINDALTEATEEEV